MVSKVLQKHIFYSCETNKTLLISAPASQRDIKAPSLTWGEHLKEEALAKLFDHRQNLMTTPKDMERIMAQSGRL